MRANLLTAAATFLKGFNACTVTFALLFLAVMPATAAGPRWVSGPPYFYEQGKPLAWYTTHPLYFTDPGDLSPSVSHDAADALVANAAGVWNVPTSSLVLARGGSLDEHVTGMAIAAQGSAPVLPADVSSANYLVKQIAVIYDADGSVIDALLGAGGSDPSGCLQTGVVESVDRFGRDATIQHALIILNGRCTGPAPEKQLQLQYQLMRAFGRVLGLGWSQTNDNVFTSSPTPTYVQAQNWPIMHPIDILCGPYTYQCLPQPFTLRPDDLSSLADLYFVSRGAGAGMPGKMDSYANGSGVDGYVLFPNGQGMSGVNVTIHRRAYFAPNEEEWESLSSVTGYRYRQATSTPLAARDGSPLSSIGSYDPAMEGYWKFELLPLPVNDPWESAVIRTEPINPLYTGMYALTTAAANASTIAPSGSNLSFQTDITSRYQFGTIWFTINDAVSDCRAGADGSVASPVAMAQTGWWTGVLCGYGHSAWTALSVRPNRSFTVEATALDETGSATAVKAMPMIGVWRASDGTGAAPIAATPAALNSYVVGMSSLTVNSGAGGALRMTIVDQRGNGRPDFAYGARVLYADSISPANVGANGGAVVISGTGFRAGALVTVNGVAATVTGVTATSITAVVPSLRSLHTTGAVLATVIVTDPVTRGVSTMTQALGYGSPQQRLQVMSAPSGTVLQGKVAGSPFAVQVLASDGQTPVAQVPVTFAVGLGYGTFGSCGQVSCTVLTDARGMASTTVTPTTVGTVTLRASTSVLSVQSSMTVSAQPDVISFVIVPTGVVTLGARAAVPFAVRVRAGDGTPRVGANVTLSVTAGMANVAACNGAVSCGVKTDATGVVATTVTPLVAGTVSLAAVSGTASVTTSFQAAPEVMSLVSAPTGVLLSGVEATTNFAVRVVAGDGTTPVAGEAVVFSAMGVGVRFAACGGPTCTVLTNAQGIAESAVTPLAVGDVTLSAVAVSGSATATFTSRLARKQSIVAAQPVVYVAEGMPVNWLAKVGLSDDSAPTDGVRVSWTGGAGISFGAETSQAGGATAVMAASVSGLGADVQASGKVCAWTNICTTLLAQGVSAAKWQLEVTAGDGQAIGVGTTFTPVSLRVLDDAGHPVLGAPVMVYQAVSARQQACPDRGRCPAAAILSSASEELVSDDNGAVQVLPVGGNGVPGTTQITVVTGTQASATITLVQHL